MEESEKTTKKPSLMLKFNTLLGDEQKLIEDKYITTVTSQQVNNLALIGKRPKNINIDLISKKATLEINGTEIEYNDDDPRKYLGVKNAIIFDYIITNLVAQNTYKDKRNVNQKVIFSLESYAKDFGRSYNEETRNATRKNIRKELISAFTALQNTKIQLKGEDNQKSSTVFCSDYVVGRDNVTFEFPTRLSEHLINQSISYTPKKAFSLSGKNPNLYPITRKLSEHYHMFNNQKKGTNNILSVKTLLKVAPEIPTYQEVMAGNRDWRGRIVEKLASILDILEKENVIKWEYCNAKKIPLTDEQLEIPSYSSFEKLYIFFEMLDTPNNTEKLEQWKEKREKPKNKPKKKKKTDD